MIVITAFKIYFDYIKENTFLLFQPKKIHKCSLLTLILFLLVKLLLDFKGS